MLNVIDRSFYHEPGFLASQNLLICNIYEYPLTLNDTNAYGLFLPEVLGPKTLLTSIVRYLLQNPSNVSLAMTVNNQL